MKNLTMLTINESMRAVNEEIAAIEALAGEMEARSEALLWRIEEDIRIHDYASRRATKGLPLIRCAHSMGKRLPALVYRWADVMLRAAKRAADKETEGQP